MNNIMKIKIVTKMLMLVCFSNFLKAGEISGRIQLKENEQLRTEVGQVFVGETNYKPEAGITNFPPYLMSMVDAVRNQRMVKIGKDGNFLIKNVPINKKLVVGISFSGVIYFIDAFLDESGSLIIEEIIDLKVKAKDLKVGVENETGKTFKSEFAAVSYLIPEASKGRVFSGKKNKLGVIDFGKVPIGLYKLYILNEEQVYGPNRVDVMSIDLTEEDPKSPYIFKIK
jgi:hypothetical protein